MLSNILDLIGRTLISLIFLLSGISKINNYDADIIATGSINAKAFIRGIVFESKLKNQIHLILGNKVAPYGYGYLIILDGRGTIAVAYKKKENKHIDIYKDPR